MDSKFYEPEVLKQLQGEILSILDDFIRICEDYHLEYFGIAGTGIGALRHKGFIPWDDDIDIAMPRRDFEHLLRIVEKKMSDRYLVLNAERYPQLSADDNPSGEEGDGVCRGGYEGCGLSVWYLSGFVCA